MYLLKLNYTTVHVNNYQGQTGEVFKQEKYLKIEKTDTIENALLKVEEFKNSTRSHISYGQENCQILSIEIVSAE